MKDVLERQKEIYVDPQYFPETVSEQPPEYDDDEVPDYGLDDEDIANETQDDMGVVNYDDVEKRLNEPEMTPQKTKSYLNKILKDAKLKKSQLKGYQAQVTKQLKRGVIAEAERQENRKRIQNANATLNQHIKYYTNKLNTTKGSGI